LCREGLADLRQLRAAEEAELEKVLQQQKNKIEAQRSERVIRLEAARQRLKDVS
jgi:hypothetical protein